MQAESSGLNRDLASKPIGVPTLDLVALGAAIVSLAGIQVPRMAENSDAMSRVVQGIIQGVMASISSVRASVILRNAQAVTFEGLTTAATVWLSTSLDIASGLGVWKTIAVAVPLSLLMLSSPRRPSRTMQIFASAEKNQLNLSARP